MPTQPTTAPFANLYSGKRVLVTGHTGFKGAWLTEWLLALGAEVTGLALPPPTTPSLFDQLDHARRLGPRHRIGDIRDPALVRDTIATARPDYIFHLAAQPLVRHSYREPLETFDTNIMGTAHILDAARLAARPCVIVAITTDKCYENKEWLHAYREEDPMGGHDPYSASKGAAELVIAAYRRSYFSAPDTPVRLASARAGNVIGGGDYAPDRIVPDCIRALQRNEPIPVRNKIATRPWQHVLEPLSGYLWLAAALTAQPTSQHATHTIPRFPFPPAAYASAFNFGPALTSNRTVAELVTELLKHWPTPGARWEDRSDPNAPHEASLLNLSTDKAHHMLHWQPTWNFEETIARTAAWYREQPTAPATATSTPATAAEHTAPAALTRAQIADYTKTARAKNLAWARA